MAKRMISDALEMIHRKYYRTPAQKARLERARQQVALGDKIRLAREKAGLTQRELAELVDTPASAISRLEDADYEGYSVRTLRKIAEALHMNLSIEFVHRDAPVAAARSPGR